MTLLKNQVVQAQCPGCQNVLRVPASWVGQMMRCKKCGLEFQAKAPKEKKKPKQRKSILARALQLGRIKKKKKRKKKSRQNIAIGKPHSPPAAIPVGLPAPPPGMPPVPVGVKAGSPPPAIPVGRPAIPAAIPVGMPAPPPASTNAFTNINDGRMRRRGGGKQKLAFLFIFLLAIGGLGAAIYTVSQQEPGDTVASVDTNNLFPDNTAPKPPPISRMSPPPIAGKEPPIRFTKLDPKQPPPLQFTNPPPIFGKEPKGPQPPIGRNPPPTQQMPPRMVDNTPPRPIPAMPTSYDNMPRRGFFIVPANYYYANPVSVGSNNFSISSMIDQFAGMMKIPPKNIVVVSDRPIVGSQPAVPPIKPVIDLNMGKFLDSCRPYDRIVVFFMGHGVEIEGVPYLMPLEGEKEKADELIPLDWIYMKLAQCSARQKVLVLDVCRYDPTKGEERGKVDPMGLAFDTMLQNPPPGVQVLTACTAGQYSYELESSSKEFGTVSGGLMLSAFPELRERLANAGSKPEDPLPIETLASGVTIRTKRMAEFFKFATPQVPRLSGTSLETGLTHDANAEPAPKVEVELAGIFKKGVASREQIRTLFTDIAGIPPVKREGGGGPMSGQMDFDNLPPFASETINPYNPDSKPMSELRLLIQEAVSTLSKGDNVVLNLRFTAPQANQNAENQFKTQIEGVQKQVSLTQFKLTVILDELKALSGEREKETKRWQANYDYVCARLEARVAYLYEYNAQLGNIRREFPARDPALHIGWQLASRERISDRDAAKNHKSALKYLEKIASEHGGTPWAMLAKREKVTSLGLEWVPLPR